jgi:hypothetical protein
MDRKPDDDEESAKVRKPLSREPNPEDPQAKQIYLRTVYPLNPGIPHFVDVPGGW